MSSRTQGIIDRLAEAEEYSDIQWILQSGVVTNYAEAVVDSRIKANMEFQAGAGLNPTIERVTVGKPCNWCLTQAGKYEHPAPPDVWRRHERCHCIIKYTANDGRVDTLSGRGTNWEIVNSTDPEMIGRRKTWGRPKKPTANQKAARRAAEAAGESDISVVGGKTLKRTTIDNIKQVAEVAVEAQKTTDGIVITNMWTAENLPALHGNISREEVIEAIRKATDPQKPFEVVFADIGEQTTVTIWP